MDFAVQEKQAELLDPFAGMTPRTIPIEIRRDPLTGRSARICHFRPLAFEPPDTAALAARTREACPFCPERVHTHTPAFAPDFAPQGRLRRGEKILFPNLAPYDALGAVATLGPEHHLPPQAISAARIAEGLALAGEFYELALRRRHPEAVYFLLSWNYLPASGSSLIHPHLQVFCSSTAPNRLREELAASAAWWRSTGRSYWEELVAEEADRGERFLGRIGGVAWLAAFAPSGVAGDVVGVVEGRRTMLDLDAVSRSDIARGLEAAIAGYAEMGISSFNVCFFPGRGEEKHFRLHLVFTPRIYYNPQLATPDATALRTLYDESICIGYPEEIAGRLRGRFAAAA